MARFVERSKNLYIELRDLSKKKESEIKRRAIFNMVKEDLLASIYKFYIDATE